MLRRFYMLLLLLAIYSQAAAFKPGGPGKIIFPGAYWTDPQPSGEFTTLVIPIKRVSNLIILEAKVDTMEGNFVLDTGAPYLVLNQTYFRNYPHYSDQDAGGVNGDAGTAFRTNVRNLDIAELHYDRLQADVTNLSAIENSRNIKILGLLGTKLFSKFAITVDLFQNQLYIHKLDKSGEIPAAEQLFHDPILKMPFYYANNAILFKASVNDNSMWFSFDTGAETNLIDYHQAKKLMPTLQIINRSKLTGIGGSTFEVIYAKFDKLVIGERVFTNNKVIITSLEQMGKAYGKDIDGMLGCDFFGRAVFTINFVKKEFIMYTNKNE
ncbi:aspartyl protease family protein [Mucilaginibacter sp. AW1-3]